MSRKIPDRWMDYESTGKRIGDTHFIAFKVPLEQAFTDNLPPEKQFSPHDLMKKLPDLSLVVDLTFTNKYYSSKVFQENNVEHLKIMCPGHVIPSKHLLKKFFDAVDQFLLKNPQNESVLIGVHCTHGINRTGYFICSYMINKLGYNSEKAISEFNAARGYDIERDNYLKALKKFDKYPITFHKKRKNEEYKDRDRDRRDRREYRNYALESYHSSYDRRYVNPSRPPYHNSYGNRNPYPYWAPPPYSNDPFYGNLYDWNRRRRRDYDDQFWKD